MTVPKLSVSPAEARRTLRLRADATPDVIVTAYSRLDLELEQRMGLNLPQLIQARLLERRVAIRDACNLLLNTAVAASGAEEVVIPNDADEPISSDA